MDDMRMPSSGAVGDPTTWHSTFSMADSWLADVNIPLVSEQVGTPVFLYSDRQFGENIERVRRAARASGIETRVEIYVPFFPNANPHVLNTLKQQGLGILVQIPSEYRLLKSFGFTNFIVSPGHVDDNEIAFWGQSGHPTFLSSLDEVAFLLTTDAKTVSVRIDSLGSEKPGIKYGQLDVLAEMLRSHNRTLESFEVYCGSGNSLESMVTILEQVLTIFNSHFPTARSINFAGGHGFVYEKWGSAEKHFEWFEYFAALRALLDRFEIPDHVKLLFEPARDVLADIGALLLRVKRDIVSNPVANLVVTDGSRMLMPSAQYRGRRHNIAFLDGQNQAVRSLAGEGDIPALIRGRTILRNDYVLPGTYLVPKEVAVNDYMVIFDVGAYCATQHMEFLNVPPAPEVLVDTGGRHELITSRGDEMDRWRHLLKQKVCIEEI